MNYLLDTHILLWALQNNPKLSQEVRQIIINPSNQLYFSVASVWEVAIKLGRQSGQSNVNDMSAADALIEPSLFYKTLLKNDYTELLINSEHAAKVLTLPLHHKDPFDRVLIAQAMLENLCFITKDSKVLKYQGLTLLKN